MEIQCRMRVIRLVISITSCIVDVDDDPWSADIAMPLCANECPASGNPPTLKSNEEKKLVDYIFKM